MEEFQYDIASVPFELFQNADDAVAELEAMQGRESRREFTSGRLIRNVTTL